MSPLFFFLCCLFLLTSSVPPSLGQSEGDLRLTGTGSTTTNGRIEIYHNNEWGTFCSDFFGLPSASVACRQLGLDLSEAAFRVVSGAEVGSGTIWIDDLVCTGTETRIDACPHSMTGTTWTHNCGHAKDIWLTCGAAVTNAVTVEVPPSQQPIMQRAAVYRVVGPSMLSNGVGTAFTLYPSVWSPFWPTLIVTASVVPSGAVTFLPSSFAVSSAAPQSVVVTSTRSDDITISITFKLSSTRYIVPPDNIILNNIGAGIYTLAGGMRCAISGVLNGDVSRISGGAYGIMGPTISSPHQMVYSKGTSRFYILLSSGFRMFDPSTNQLSTPVGSVYADYATADGVGATAKFRSVSAASIDATGEWMYIADSTTVRRVNLLTYAVRTLAGTFDTSSLAYLDRTATINQRIATWPMELSMDGTGGASAGPFQTSQAVISAGCTGVAFDSLRNRVWFTDSAWHLLRFVNLADPLFNVTSLHGIPAVPGWRDSTTLSPVALLNKPSGLALASSLTASESVQAGGDTSAALLDRLFIADEGNNAIRLLDLSIGSLVTFAGSPSNTVNFDGLGTAAGIAKPNSLAIDSSNTYLFVGSRSHNAIRRISLQTALVETLVLRGFNFTTVYSLLGHPHVATQLFLTEFSAHQVWSVDLSEPNRRVLPFLGGGAGCLTPAQSVPGSLDGTGTRAYFTQPRDVAINPFDTNQLYVADTIGLALRVLDLRFQNVSTLAFFPDSLILPSDLAVHPLRAGLVFLASPSAIVWVNTHTGSFGALAGVQGANGTTDSPAALFANIQTIAVSTDGTTLYVGDQCRIRAVDISGSLAVDSAAVTSLAGVAGECVAVAGGAGVARFGALVSVMPVGDSLLYLAEATKCVISTFDLRTLTRTVVAGAVCTTLIDDYGTTARFTSITAAAYSADTNYIYVTSDSGLRFFDLSTSRVGTALAAGTNTNDGVGAGVGFVGVSGLGVAPNGHKVYVAESTYRRVRSVTLWAAPAINTITPSVCTPNFPAIITLTGLNFGVTIFDLVSISAQSTDGSTYSCTQVSWAAATSLTCRLGTNVPIGKQLRFAINVRGVWGSLSTTVLRTVPQPVIVALAPAIETVMPTLIHLVGTFNTEQQADVITVTYGATGTQYSCTSIHLINSTCLACAPSTTLFVDQPAYFIVNIGGQYSPLSPPFVLRSTPRSLTRICPTTVAAIYSTAIAVWGDFSGLTTSDAKIPVGLLVEFRNAASPTVILQGAHVTFVSASQITVHTPSDLASGTVWDVRVSIGRLVGSWLSSVMTVVPVVSPILAVTPRILTPFQPATLTITYSPAALCTETSVLQQITGVWWGGQGAERAVGSFTVESTNTIRVTIPAEQLQLTGQLHAFQLIIGGARSPPSLRNLHESGGVFDYSAGAIFVQSELTIVTPVKLTGAADITIGPNNAPQLGTLVVIATIYAKPAYPSGSAESLQSTTTLTFTGASWSAQSIPVTLLSVAATFRVTFALHSSTTISPSTPFFLPPISEVSVPGIASITARTVFGPGPLCSASGNETVNALPGSNRAPLQNPIDAIFDQSTGSYLILDQDGALLRRWFPSTNVWQLVYGSTQAPRDAPSPNRDGPVGDTIIGRSMYSRARMTLAADGSRLYLWDAQHWQIRMIDFAADLCSTISGVNTGPLMKTPNWDTPWISGYFATSVGIKWLDVHALVVDRAQQYLYVAELQSVRRVEIATGATTIISGRADYYTAPYDWYMTDGVGSTCLWSQPPSGTYARTGQIGLQSMFLSADETTLYVLDKSGVIRTIDLATLACTRRVGSGQVSSSDSTFGSQGSLFLPIAMTVDPAQANMYILEYNDRFYTSIMQTGLRRVQLTSNYPLTTLAHYQSTFGGPRDGRFTGTPSEKAAGWGQMSSFRIHPSGDFIYMADTSAHRIRTLHLRNLTLGTLVGGGSSRSAIDHPTDPAINICPGEGNIPGVTDATGLDAQFNLIVGLITTPPNLGRSNVAWAMDWQNGSYSSVRRIDLESDVVTTSFSIAGHVVEFQSSATNPNLAYIGLFNGGGSIFMVNLETSNLISVGSMNTGPLGSLGRIRSIATVDDMQVFVAIDLKPALYALDTGTNPDAVLKAGHATATGDADGMGPFARFGIVKHLCRSYDFVHIYFTTWAPYKVLRYNTYTQEVRTISGLSLSRTPAVPVSVDGYPPTAALAWPTTLQASADGKSLYIFEFLDTQTAQRVDWIFQTERFQILAQLRVLTLSTGELITIVVNDGYAYYYPSKINLATGRSTGQDFDQPHPLAITRSASMAQDGVDGSHLLLGRESRIRVMQLMGAPLIRDVRPRVAPVSASVTVTLTGTGFGADASSLLAIDYRNQLLFPTGDASITGSAMPPVTTCTTITWISSTSATCTLTMGATLGVRFSFRVHVSSPTVTGDRLVSRHSLIELTSVALAVVSMVTPNTGPASTSRRVTLTSATKFGFGSGVEERSVLFGLVGSTTGSPCTDINNIDEYSLSCMVATGAAGNQYWFTVTVGGLVPAPNPSVTSVNSYLVSAPPALSAVCPPGSRLVNREQVVVLTGTNMGNSIENVDITTGPNGIEYICSNPQYIASTGGISCVIPSTIPVTVTEIKFRITVRGQTSSVSSFTFVLSTSATIPNGASSSLISAAIPGVGAGMTPGAGLMPGVADLWVTLQGTGFGACAAMVTGVFWTAGVYDSTGSSFPTSVSNYMWVSPTEVRVQLPVGSANTIKRFQLELLGVRGPGSASNVQVWYMNQLVTSGPSGVEYEAAAWPTPTFALPAAPTYALQLTANLSTSLPTSATWPYPHSNTYTLSPSSYTASWAPAIPQPDDETVFRIVFKLECSPALAAGAYALCQTWLATNYIQPSPMQWGFVYYPAVFTAAGPGGCANSLTVNGVDGSSDSPSFYAATAIRATDEVVYLQEPYGIRIFNRSSRRISPLSGTVISMSNPQDGVGTAAGWDWFYNKPVAQMAYDGARYIYAGAKSGRVLKRVDVTTGATLTVYGSYALSCTASSCSYSSCPANCYTDSDSLCGTDAYMAQAAGFGADPRGRYVYITDLRGTVRRVDTNTWCPTTMYGPVATNFGTSPIHVDPSGTYIYVHMSSSVRQFDVTSLASVLVGGAPLPADSRMHSSNVWYSTYIATVGVWTMQRVRKHVLLSDLTFAEPIDVMETRNSFYRDGPWVGPSNLIASVYGTIEQRFDIMPTGEFLFYDQSQRLRVADLEAKTITTMAGGGEQAQCRDPLTGPKDGIGVDASLNRPTKLAYGPLAPDQMPFEHPYAYFLDMLPVGSIRRFDVKTGEVRTLPLNQGDSWSISVDFLALAVSPVWAHQLMVIATNSYLLRVDLTTMNTTFLAGQRSTLSGTDGTAIQATFNKPSSMVFDKWGTYLYVADRLSYSVRRVRMSDGLTRTMAGGGPGGGQMGDIFDGYGMLSLMGYVEAVAYDQASTIGNERLFVLTSSGNRVLSLNLQTGRSTVVLGSSTFASQCGTPVWGIDTPLCTHASIVASPVDSRLYLSSDYYGMRSFDSMTNGSLPSGIFASTWTTNGLGTSVRIFGATAGGLGIHPSGNFLLSMELTYSYRIRMFALNRVPHIEYIWPPTATLGASTTITLRGYRMGESAGQLTKISYGDRGHENECTDTAWIDNRRVTCTVSAAGIASSTRIYFLVTNTRGLSTQHLNGSIPVYPAPVVSSVTPVQGSANVAYVVTLSGLYFGIDPTQLTAATYTATPIVTGAGPTYTDACTASKWISDDKVTCQIPSTIPPDYNIAFTASRDGATSALSSAVLVATAPPVISITSICPPSAAAFVLSPIYLSGSGFGSSLADVDLVRIDPVDTSKPSAQCGSVHFLSSGALSCLFPAAIGPPLNPGPFRFVIVSHGVDGAPSPEWGFGTGTTPFVTHMTVTSIMRQQLPAIVTITGGNFGCCQ